MSFVSHKIVLFTFIAVATGYSTHLKSAREGHRLQLSTNEHLRQLAVLSDPAYVNKVLDNILIPRVVGTQNHERVFAYIVRQLERLKWHVDVDEFVAKAPIFGNLTFKNILATHNPDADRFLVLACHYDSKYFKKGVFVGATDSAVPCAMMLTIARSLARHLGNSEVALKLIFFDGEEAFKEWGPHDSIYGAKHLAQELQTRKSRKYDEEVNELDKMDVLVLLDLIGMKNPNFLNYFEETQRWFVRLMQLEQELHRLNLLKNHRYAYFQTGNPYGRIEDDHVPFLLRGVPIVHLITSPFPPEWHTTRDNRDVVDMDTVNNLNLILKAFVSEYLHLSVAESSVHPLEKEL